MKPIMLICLICACFCCALQSAEDYKWEKEVDGWKEWWSLDRSIYVARGNIVGLRVYHYDVSGKMTNYDETFIDKNKIVSISGQHSINSHKERYTTFYLEGGAKVIMGFDQQGGLKENVISRHKFPSALYLANYFFNIHKGKEIP